ncbi:hypothetical protein PUR71_39575 [Streptomyces sp. SP17BM10]|uniref:hypothetical protein n=1 Tax=Streptomyces sp. SP17BM10 TaxID=3002530 RepID=UPI002E77FA63|nr:hypothetical protein [Streptomyces sp. SP17BM10]MEE1788959.1 hypothetical protein [Streptomyces sp. SP17BM10]
MSTPADIVTAALLGTGAALSAAILISQRGAKAESVAVMQVLAESAAERAARAAAGTDTAPPDGGEGAPAPAMAEQPARLATVHQLPSARARRAA